MRTVISDWARAGANSLLPGGDAVGAKNISLDIAVGAVTESGGRGGRHFGCDVSEQRGSRTGSPSAS